MSPPDTLFHTMSTSFHLRKLWHSFSTALSFPLSVYGRGYSMHAETESKRQIPEAAFRFCLLSNTAAGQSELPRLRSEKAGLISPLPGRSEVTPCTGTAAHSNADLRNVAARQRRQQGGSRAKTNPLVRKEFELTTRTDCGHCGEQTLQLHATKREFWRLTFVSFCGVVVASEYSQFQTSC